MCSFYFLMSLCNLSIQFKFQEYTAKYQSLLLMHILIRPLVPNSVTILHTSATMVIMLKINLLRSLLVVLMDNGAMDQHANVRTCYFFPISYSKKYSNSEAYASEFLLKPELNVCRKVDSKYTQSDKISVKLFAKHLGCGSYQFAWCSQI